MVGTYVGCRFSENTNKFLKEIQKRLKIPNPYQKFHVTIAYSRKELNNFNSLGLLKNKWTAKFDGIDFFKTGMDETCLVLKLRSEELSKRHHQLNDEYGATYDYEEYIPHITLTYSLSNEEIDYDLLKKILENKVFEIIEEYHEDLIEV